MVFHYLDAYLAVNCRGGCIVLPLGRRFSAMLTLGPAVFFEDPERLPTMWLVELEAVARTLPLLLL